MLAVGGCGSGAGKRVIRTEASGPPGVVRVALTDFRWPLDPALVRGRDETTLARALYSTPLRIDAATGAPTAGLCSGWAASDELHTWTLTCRNAPAIAAALRRVGRLTDAPSHWLFADARIAAPSASRLVVRLPFAWRRFPYALTAVAAAPRFVPGPFRVVSGSPDNIIARSNTLTLDFRRYTARAAQRAFERGEVDEAPVPLGEIARTRARLGDDVVRSRTLLALDAVTLRRLRPELRRVYWDTAGRNDYAELVAEERGAAALSVVSRDVKGTPRAYRRAVGSIPTLPRVRVRIGVPADATLRYGARVLYAQWRDVGLGPQLVTEPAAALDGSLTRWFASYPQAEALPAELALGARIGSRALALRALAAADQGAALDALDEDLRASARLVPVSWVVDARVVSPRLRGWSDDALGAVDYAAVRSLASSRRR
ncbi:MAG: hypothetical protein ACJ74C_10695 [Gaiellaceae bacterium]